MTFDGFVCLAEASLVYKVVSDLAPAIERVHIPALG